MDEKSDHHGNVVVAVRIRPLYASEDAAVFVAVGDDAVREKGGALVGDRDHAYDFVFGPACPTADVFERVAEPIASAALEGVNGTIFAYGQTSSGKTHTMLGDEAGGGGGG